jgi:integrase
MADATGPKRTGSLDTDRDKAGRVRHRGRIRLADGTRLRIPVPAGFSEARARDFVQAIQEREDAQGLLLAKRRREAGRATDGGETVDVWHARFLATVVCGESYRRITASTWARWVSPRLGASPIADLTRDMLEDLRDDLDRAIVEGRLAPKSAQNVWSSVTSAMKAACASKDRSLRVHPTPLHVGILPPTRGASAQRPWIFPREWSLLWECEAVPEDLRFLYAVGIFTGLRPGEIRALTWADVNLETRRISVTKAFDEATGKAKPPKTRAGVREVPIHEHLMPILEARMGHPDASVAPPVVWVDLAEGFRAHLKTAGVTRPRLFAKTATAEPCDFRSLRDSAASWWALEGVPLATLRRRLGHQTIQQSDMYVKAAEAFDVEGVGLPFPALSGQKPGPRIAKSPELLHKVAPTVGLEPTTRRLTAACSTN